MKKVKQVNIVFMMSALMPYIAFLILDITGFQIRTGVGQILFSQIVFALPAVIYLIVCGTNPFKALRVKRIKISNVFLLILFAYLIMPLISLINAISLVFSQNEIVGTITNVTDNSPLIVGILTVGLLPAILEESVYRGVLYNEYRKANPKIAIFLSALLFGLLHQNLNQFSYAFALGLIFALVIEATDSILSTMILHFVINSTSLVMNYMLPRILKAMEAFVGSDVMNAEEVLESALEGADKVTMIQSAYSLIVPAIISSILAFIVYRVIAKNENRYEEVKNIFARNESNSRLLSFISVPLVIGVGICIYNIIVLLVSVKLS